MPYARTLELYDELLAQVVKNRHDNATEIALDALKSAYADESDDFIKPIVDIGLNFELSGRFGGDQVELMLNVRTKKSLAKAIPLLRNKDIRVEVQTNGDRIRNEITNQVPATDRLICFFVGPSCFLTLHKHPRHDMIVLQVIK